MVSDLPGLRCGDRSDRGNEELVALMLLSPAAFRKVRPMHQTNGCFRSGILGSECRQAMVVDGDSGRSFGPAANVSCLT